MGVTCTDLLELQGCTRLQELRLIDMPEDLGVLPKSLRLLKMSKVAPTDLLSIAEGKVFDLMPSLQVQVSGLVVDASIVDEPAAKFADVLSLCADRIHAHVRPSIESILDLSANAAGHIPCTWLLDALAPLEGLFMRRVFGLSLNGIRVGQSDVVRLFRFCPGLEELHVGDMASDALQEVVTRPQLYELSCVMRGGAYEYHLIAACIAAQHLRQRPLLVRLHPSNEVSSEQVDTIVAKWAGFVPEPCMVELENSGFHNYSMAWGGSSSDDDDDGDGADADE